MSLDLHKIKDYLATEQPWVGFDPRRRSFGQVGSRAPVWAKVAIESKIIPPLKGRLQTANLNDWATLALWRCWVGGKFNEQDPGSQLCYSLESDWADFSRWVFDRFAV